MWRKRNHAETSLARYYITATNKTSTGTRGTTSEEVISEGEKNGRKCFKLGSSKYLCSSSVHPAFRGRRHSRHRIYLKRKYCTIVTSQPSREDREIEKERVALLLNIWFTFFLSFFKTYQFFLFLYTSMLSPQSHTHTHMKISSVYDCVAFLFVLFFLSLLYRLCVCVCVCSRRHTYRYARTPICRHALFCSHTLTCTCSQSRAHTYSQAHMLTGRIRVNMMQFCTFVCVPVLKMQWRQ